MRWYVCTYRRYAFSGWITCNQVLVKDTSVNYVYVAVQGGGSWWVVMFWGKLCKTRGTILGVLR